MTLFLWEAHGLRYDGHGGTTAGLVELGPRQAIAVSAILGLAWINTKGVGRAGSFQLAVTSGKVLGLLLLLATIAVFGHSSLEQQPLPEAVRGPSALEFGGALLAVMSAYNGWANAAIVGGEVWDAKRTVPFALVAGIMIVTGLYVMSNLAFLHTLSLQDIATANSSRYPQAPSVASRAVNHALGPRAAMLLPILFAVSALGTAHCNVLVVPRVFLSMARDGLLPSYLSKVSNQSATPNRAIWTFAYIAAVFASFGTVDRLSNMTAFAFLVFFALTTIGYLSSCRATPPGARDAKFWLANSVALLFLLGTSLLILASIARGSFEVLSAVALMSAGIPIFAASEFFRRRRAHCAQRRG